MGASRPSSTSSSSSALWLILLASAVLPILVLAQNRTYLHRRTMRSDIAWLPNNPSFFASISKIGSSIVTSQCIKLGKIREKSNWKRSTLGGDKLWYLRGFGGSKAPRLFLPILATKVMEMAQPVVAFVAFRTKWYLSPRCLCEFKSPLEQSLDLARQKITGPWSHGSLSYLSHASQTFSLDFVSYGSKMDVPSMVSCQYRIAYRVFESSHGGWNSNCP